MKQLNGFMVVMVKLSLDTIYTKMKIPKRIKNCPFCNGKVENHPDPTYSKWYYIVRHNPGCYMLDGCSTIFAFNFTLLPKNYRIQQWNERIQKTNRKTQNANDK